MQNITSKAELHIAIQQLEVEQDFKLQLLREQVFVTFESFRPLNLMKSAFKDLVSSPNLTENIVDTAIGLGSGFITKKIVVGASSNIIRNLLGLVMQFGVTNVMTNHPGAIKSVFNKLFHKKTQQRES